MKFTLVRRKILGPERSTLANAKIPTDYEFIILKEFFEEISCSIFVIFNVLYHCNHYV